MPLGYVTGIGCEFYKYRPLGNYFFTAGDARYYFNILSIGLPNCYKAFLVAVLVYLYEHKEFVEFFGESFRRNNYCIMFSR